MWCLPKWKTNWHLLRCLCFVLFIQKRGRNLPSTRFMARALLTWPCFFAFLSGDVRSLTVSEFRASPLFFNAFALFSLSLRMVLTCFALTETGACMEFSEGISTFSHSSRWVKSAGLGFEAGWANKCARSVVSGVSSCADQESSHMNDERVSACVAIMSLLHSLASCVDP